MTSGRSHHYCVACSCSRRATASRLMMAPLCGLTHGRGFFSRHLSVAACASSIARVGRSHFSAVIAKSKISGCFRSVPSPRNRQDDRDRSLSFQSGSDAAPKCSILKSVELRFGRSSYKALSRVCCEFETDSGILHLRGSLPSYYLKQVAQELVLDLEGVLLVNNQIKVARPSIKKM